MTHRCPSWLVWDDAKGGWKPKPDAKRTILFIFKRTIEGIGQQRLTAELHRKFKPFTGEKWYSSMVANLLLSRAVLGELITDGKPSIPDYYPRIVPDSLFYQARMPLPQDGTPKDEAGCSSICSLGLCGSWTGIPAMSGLALANPLPSGGSFHRDTRTGSPMLAPCPLIIGRWNATSWLPCINSAPPTC